MSFQIATLALGEHHLCTLGDPVEVSFSLCADRLDVATQELQAGRQRYCINGAPGPWYTRVESIEFSPFPSYHYDIINGESPGFVINGMPFPTVTLTSMEQPPERCCCWDVAKDDIPLWSYATGQHSDSFIGMERTLHPFYAPVQLLPDLREFLYEAAIPGPEYCYFLMRGNNVIFPGKVYDVRVHAELPLYSWVGIGQENRAMVYLCGTASDFAMNRNDFASGSFFVDDDHAHFLIGTAMDDSTLQLRINGRDSGCTAPADGLYDADFAPGGTSYYFASDNDAGNTTLIRDNRPVELDGEAFDFHFRGETLWYVAAAAVGHCLIAHMHSCSRVVATWPAIQYQSLALSADGRHHACIVRESDASDTWAFVLDNTPVWRFDDVIRRSAAYYEGDGRPLRFLEDGRVICAGIKGGELMVYVAEP